MPSKQTPLNIHKVVKGLAKALIRLRVCAGWSESLLVAHTTLLEISSRGLFSCADSKELVHNVDKSCFSVVRLSVCTHLFSI